MGEKSKRKDESTSRSVLIEIEMPSELDKFSLPKGVDERLQFLLDKQDRGEALTSAERMEAEGLVNLAELLSLLRSRAQRVSQVRKAIPRVREGTH